MKRLKGYSKKVTLAILFFVTGVFLTSFDSFASSEFDFVYNSAEPTCNEGQGYLVLLMHNGNNYNTRLYSFMSSTVNNDGAYMPTTSMINITSSHVTFNINANGAAVSGFHAVYYIAQSGNMTLVGASDSDSIVISPTGGEIVSWQVYGNGYVASNTQNSSQYWSVSFRGGDAMNQYAMEIVEALNEFIFSNGENTEAINSKLESLEQYLLDIHNESIYTNEQLEGIYDFASSILENTDLVLEELNDIFSEVEATRRLVSNVVTKVDYCYQELKKSNTWLEKIWNSIQRFFDPTDEEMEESEQFKNDTSEKSEEIGGLVEESQTEKPNIDDMSNSIDSNLDMTSANEYGAILLTITENEYVLQMLLIVVTVAIIAYVLFGKR